MNPADRITPRPKLAPEPGVNAVSAAERKKLSQSAEDYVAIENRLAAQREKPQPGPQLNSIFDQLRGRLPH